MPGKGKEYKAGTTKLYPIEFPPLLAHLGTLDWARLGLGPAGALELDGME